MKIALLTFLGWFWLGYGLLVAQQNVLTPGVRINRATQTAIWVMPTLTDAPTEVWVYQQHNGPNDRPDSGQYWFSTRFVAQHNTNFLYEIPGMRQQILVQTTPAVTAGVCALRVFYRKAGANIPDCNLTPGSFITVTRRSEVRDTTKPYFITVGPHQPLSGRPADMATATRMITESFATPPASFEDDSEEYNPGGDVDLKPVLYLYAPKPTVCHVRVDPGTPFTVIYPAYPPTGWQVETCPDGQLTHLADGHTYPSLFWEAPVATAPTPPATAAVQLTPNEIPNYLETNLTALGLNARERAEFIQFWLPRLAAHPAVSVQLGWQCQHAGQALQTAPGWEGFFATNQLAITPQPEYLIRVRILWEPVLEALPHRFGPPPVAANAATDAPTLPRPGPQTGLYAVEWGGMRNQTCPTANLPRRMVGE